MKAKLIWHSVAVWSQEKQSSLQKAELIVYGVSYSIICETNNRDGKAFKVRVCAGKGGADTTAVRSDGRTERGFPSRDGVSDEADILHRLHISQQIFKMLAFFEDVCCAQGGTYCIGLGEKSLIKILTNKRG